MVEQAMVVPGSERRACEIKGAVQPTRANHRSEWTFMAIVELHVERSAPQTAGEAHH